MLNVPNCPNTDVNDVNIVWHCSKIVQNQNVHDFKIFGGRAGPWKCCKDWNWLYSKYPKHCSSKHFFAFNLKEKGYYESTITFCTVFWFWIWSDPVGSGSGLNIFKNWDIQQSKYKIQIIWISIKSGQIISGNQISGETLLKIMFSKWW